MSDRERRAGGREPAGGGHAEALIGRIRHVHVYTNEQLPDGTRRALFVGPHRERLMGGAVPEGLDAAREWLRLIHPDDLEAHLGHAERNRRGEPSEVEYRLVGYDGVTRWVHARTEPRTGAERGIYDGVVWDVSERKRAEHALAASHERLETLVANVPGIVYQIGLAEQPGVLFLSVAIETMFGYPTEDFHGAEPRRTLDAITHPDDRPLVSSARAGAAATGPFAIEYRVIDAAGDIRWVYEQAQVAVRPDAEPRSLDGVIFDISDRKHVEAELARMETELRLAQKLEAVGQLAAGMAHEINTPIQFTMDSLVFLRDVFGELVEAVGAYRRLALGQAAAEVDAIDEQIDLAYLEERAPAAFDRAGQGLDRVSEIVRAMKTFAQPEQRDFGPADLNEALRTTLDVARREYTEIADLETAFSPLPLVVCRVCDLNQVFLSLVVNAAQAIADGSRPRGTIRVVTERAGENVVVEVADDGCGIPAEVAERLFDPFFTTREVGSGSGQGLAVARAVVGHHGGTIAFESQPGVGTCFVVTLPIAGPEVIRAATGVPDVSS